MKATVLASPGKIAERPLHIEEMPRPESRKRDRFCFACSPVASAGLTCILSKASLLPCARD